jgi:hypothetical protein
MNYEQLIEELQTLPRDACQCTVTVFWGGEFIPIKEIRVQVGADVLDDGHPYLNPTP